MSIDMKDYVNKVLNEAAYFRELGLEQTTVQVKKIAKGTSFFIIVPKHQIRYRDVKEGDILSFWWRKAEADKMKNIKLLNKEINRKIAFIEKADQSEERKVDMSDFKVDLEEEPQED